MLFEGKGQLHPIFENLINKSTFKKPFLMCLIGNTDSQQKNSKPLLENKFAQIIFSLLFI